VRMTAGRPPAQAAVTITLERNVRRACDSVPGHEVPQRLARADKHMPSTASGLRSQGKGPSDILSTYPLREKLPHFVALTRLDRPIGILLLLWPMLWALWFAAEGIPKLDVLIVFVLGTVLTRSAGCAINDYADRHIDGQVARTHQRPLVSGALQGREALVLAALLMLAAFVLVLTMNRLTIALSVVALALAAVYPFSKRVTYFPQLVLGAAFGFAVPMAFAAETDSLPPLAWMLYATALLWALAYDTLYAMADREDDLKIGVKSTAILFGRADIVVVALVQVLVIGLLAFIGQAEGRGLPYALGLVAAATLAARQLWMVRQREPARCLAAFLDNNRLGLAVFIGLVVDYAVNP